MNTVSVNGIENLISYDFKHANTDFDYENSVFNTHKERQLKDITTDTFIEDMFSDTRPDNDDVKNVQRENNRFNFLAYVYTYLSLQVKLGLPQALIENNIIMKPGEDVYLLFKGGNMMYYKYEELKKHVKPILQGQFFRLFDANFKISDFDFTCYIVVNDRERFYKVKKAVNQILWRETVKLRNFFESYMNVALDSAVNPELNGEPTQKDNNIFYPLENLDVNQVNTNKEERIQNIKNRLFEGVNIITSEDNHEVILNKAMQINEQITDNTKLDFQQVQSTLFHLRTYLYRKMIYHKTPQKLSQSFDVQYKQLNQDLKTMIVLMWRKISKYITDIKINDQNEFLNIIKGVHIPTLLAVHEVMVYIKQYREIIFDQEHNVNELILTQQSNDLHRFLQTFIQNFTLIFQNRIVESDFYNIFTISELLKNVRKKFTDKQDTLQVCETIYDEYQSFEEDVKKLKDRTNYNFIQLQGKELEVYMEKREDFYIQPSLLENSTTYIDTSRSSFHYVYQNSTIKKLRNQSSSVVDFDLLRVKFNVNLRASEKVIKVPSEFIDISICNYDDSALTEFRNHTEEGLGLFSISNTNNGNNLVLECFGYSIDFMVHDLIYVLYEQNLFTPWADAKYHKRIQRLNALQMLSYIGDINSMKLYLLSVLVIYIIVTYSEVYVERQGKIDINEDMDRLYNNARDNVILNFKKYSLERVFNILPTSMLDVIYRTYLPEPEYKNLMIPYPDSIIGSIVFYSLLQQYYVQGNENDKTRIKDIINRYRHDFMFLPADNEDIDRTIKDSMKYVEQMGDTFSEMLDLVKVQVQSGGIEQVQSTQVKAPKVKKQYTFF